MCSYFSSSLYLKTNQNKNKYIKHSYYFEIRQALPSPIINIELIYGNMFTQICLMQQFFSKHIVQLHDKCIKVNITFA